MGCRLVRCSRPPLPQTFDYIGPAAPVEAPRGAEDGVAVGHLTGSARSGGLSWLASGATRGLHSCCCNMLAPAPVKQLLCAAARVDSHLRSVFPALPLGPSSRRQMLQMADSDSSQRIVPLAPKFVEISARRAKTALRRQFRRTSVQPRGGPSGVATQHLLDGGRDRQTIRLFCGVQAHVPPHARHSALVRLCLRLGRGRGQTSAPSFLTSLRCGVGGLGVGLLFLKAAKRVFFPLRGGDVDDMNEFLGGGLALRGVRVESAASYVPRGPHRHARRAVARGGGKTRDKGSRRCGRWRFFAMDCTCPVRYHAQFPRPHGMMARAYRAAAQKVCAAPWMAMPPALLQKAELFVAPWRRCRCLARCARRRVGLSWAVLPRSPRRGARTTRLQCRQSGRAAGSGTPRQRHGADAGRGMRATPGGGSCGHATRRNPVEAGAGRQKSGTRERERVCFGGGGRSDVLRQPTPPL